MRVTTAARRLRHQRSAPPIASAMPASLVSASSRITSSPATCSTGGERHPLRDAELAHAGDARMLEAAVRARRRRQRLRVRRLRREVGQEPLTAN